MWKAVWPAAVIAFLVDVCADLIWGNATVNVITFIVTFVVAAFVIYAVRSQRVPA